MIEVDLSVVSAVDGQRRYAGKIVVYNDGGDDERGDYRVVVYGDGLQRRRGVWKRGRVRGFPRRDSELGIYDLVSAALRSALKGRDGSTAPGDGKTVEFSRGSSCAKTSKH